MWQRFSEEARKVVFNAQAVAESRQDGQVSSGHILIGLCMQAGTAADHILALHKLSQPQVHVATEAALPSERLALNRHMTLTADAKRVVDLAYDEARRLKDRFIGTEHLLLACVASKSGVAPQVLAGLGVTIESAREALLTSRVSP